MKKVKSFNELYENSLKTVGADKLWNYYLDLIKTEKFQKDAEKFRKEVKEREKSNYHDIGQRIIATAISYGFDGELWEETFSDYIFRDKLTKPEGVDMCKLANIPELDELFTEGKIDDESDFALQMKSLDHPLEHYNKYMNLLLNYPIAILVNPRASLRDILDFVTKNYNLQISNYKKAYKKLNTAEGLGKSKRKKSSIQERNELIYQNRHLPSKEILRILYSKYGFKLEMDQAYIGKIISMERKKRKEV